MASQVDSLPLVLKILAIALLAVGVLGGWWFVARYMLLFKWRSTEIGRHLVAFSSLLALFYTYYLVYSFLPNAPGKTPIRLGLFVALTGVILWRVVIFERVAAEARRQRKDKEPE